VGLDGFSRGTTRHKGDYNAYHQDFNIFLILLQTSGPNPSVFMNMLIPKLEKVKKEREIRERVETKLESVGVGLLICARLFFGCIFFYAFSILANAVFKNYFKISP
jgi:hypothetical protein